MDRLIKNITEHIMCVISNEDDKKEIEKQIAWVVRRHLEAYLQQAKEDE